MTVPALRAKQLLTEAQWQTIVIEVARLNGWWVHHHYDSRRSEPGWPDLVLLRDGEALFVELKREDGKVAAAQAYVLDLLESAGCEACVWRPSDEERAFARLSRRRP
jgi:hypothetical protein